LSPTSVFAAKEAAQKAAQEAAFERYHKNLDHIISSKQDAAARQRFNIQEKQRKMSKPNWEKAKAPQLEVKRKKENRRIAKRNRQDNRAAQRKIKIMHQSESDDEIQHHSNDAFEHNA